MANNDLSFLKQPKHTGVLEAETCSDKKKKTGRPAKNIEDKKTEAVKVYLTVEEKKKLEAAADLGFGVSISLGQLIRKVLLEKDLI